MTTKFALIDGPGYVTDNKTTIRSVHRTLKLAQRARAHGEAIIEVGDGAAKGHAVYMDMYAGHRWDSDHVLRR